jgi:hypothetical protein
MMAKIRKGALRLRRVVQIGLRAPATLRYLEARYGAINRRAISRVAVFPDLGLAYNRVKKNANTSTIILLRQLESGGIEERNDAKWNARTYFDFADPAQQGLDALHLFIIIRDPYSRVLSAFLDKFRTEHYQRKHGHFELTPEGFGQFLRWLENGGLKRDAHWDLQTRLMMLPLEKYDTVIRFENYRDGLRNLLESRALTLPPDALKELYPSDRAKETKSSSKLAQFYTPGRAELVRRLFAEDFRALGYPTEFPEPLS